MSEIINGSIKELAAALSKAQKEFKPIKKNKTVTVRSDKGNYTFDYADYDQIMSAVQDALSNNGLAVTQILQDTKLYSVLMHNSGEQSSSFMEIGVPQGRIQEFGAKLTYCRRYLVTMQLNLSTEDDTDGAAEGTQQVTKKPASAKPTLLHKPTDGAMESLTQEQTERIESLAIEMIAFVHNKQGMKALERFDEEKLDADESVALWSLLDSKVRSELKRLDVAARASAKAEQDKGEGKAA
jgi:hypothetical protein